MRTSRNLGVFLLFAGAIMLSATHASAGGPERGLIRYWPNSRIFVDRSLLSCPKQSKGLSALLGSTEEFGTFIEARGQSARARREDNAEPVRDGKVRVTVEESPSSAGPGAILSQFVFFGDEGEGDAVPVLLYEVYEERLKAPGVPAEEIVLEIASRVKRTIVPGGQKPERSKTRRKK